MAEFTRHCFAVEIIARSQGLNVSNIFLPYQLVEDVPLREFIQFHDHVMKDIHSWFISLTLIVGDNIHCEYFNH